MKMKKLKTGLAMLLLVAGTASITSCKKNDPVDPDDPVDPVAEEFTVTFNTNGGSTIANATTSSGKVAKPTDPTKAGNTFKGWYTDAACTKEFKFDTVLTENTTLYAKWEASQSDPDADKIKIATKEEFVQMVKGQLEEVAEGQGLVEEYILTADIDLEGVDLGAELGQTAYSFQGILDGRDHTVKNLNLVRQKKQVGLFEGLYGAVIKNLKFENVSLSNAPVDAEGNPALSDCRGVSLFGNYAAGGTSFENIVIDGFEVKVNADSTKVEESAGLVVNLFDTVYLDNIAITGMDVTLGKNSGAVLGSMRVPTDSLKVAGTDVADKTPCIVKANNILLEGNITGTTSDSQGLGGLIGRCDNVVDGTAIEIDGFVFKGNIKATKNSGVAVGNVKNDMKVSIKNAYYIEGESLASGMQSTANVFVGQYKAQGDNAIFENCHYVDRLVSVEKTNKEFTETVDVQYLDPAIASPIKASEITAFKDFTVADGKITLNGLSIDLPEDVTVSEVAAPTVEFDTNVVIAVDKHTVTVTGQVKYYHAADPNGPGAAGNYVAFTFTAAQEVATTDAAYFVTTAEGTAATYVNANTFVVFVPVAELTPEVTTRESQTLTIRWNKNAADQTYTVNFADDLTLEAAPEYGAISQDVAGFEAANPTVEEVIDPYTLAYTAGNIEWNAAKNGNVVTVKVAKPSWVTEIQQAEITVSDTASIVSFEGDVLTVLAIAKSSGSNFTVQWGATTDAKKYELTFGSNVTFAADPSASIPTETISYDGSASSNPGFTIVQAAAGSSKFVSLTEGAAASASGEAGTSLKKLVGTADYVETVAFTATTYAKVSVLGGTTSSSNTQIFKIEAIGAADQVVETVYSAPSMSGKLLGYITSSTGDKFITIKTEAGKEFVKIRITATGDKATLGDGAMANKNWCPAKIDVSYGVSQSN